MADGVIDSISIEIGASATKAEQQINSLITALEKLKSASVGKVDLSGINQTTENASNAEQKVQNLTNKVKSLKGAGSPRVASQSGQSDIEGEKSVRSLNDIFRELPSSISHAISSIQQFGGATKSAKPGVERFSEGLKRVQSLFHSFGRIALYRIIRSAIKAITEAFQQGAENAYWYSKTIGDQTKYIAEAYDSLSSGSFKMSNQLGAAWATLKAAITPILIQIINLVTAAANAITQLFAILGGKGTYLKAVDYNKQWADSAGGAAKAAKEWKNQLLGFDELNRLEAPADTGGGGGGGLPLDYENMFEEAAVSKKLKELIALLKERLQPAIDRCKEAFERLKEAWGKLMESFSRDGPLRELVLDLAMLGGDFILNGITLLTDTLTLLLDVLTALQTGDWGSVWIDLKKVFDDLWQAVWDLVWNGLIVLADAIDTLIPGEQHLADTLRDLKNGTYQVTYETENGAKTIYTMADAATDAAAKLNGTYQPSLEDTERAHKSWKDAAQAASEKLSGTFKPSLENTQSAMKTFEKAMSGVSDVLKKLGFTKTAHITWSSGSANFFGRTISWSIPNISWYANGGFPEDGLFMANHGELVGKFSNGKTAVANNEQIIDGIRQGVYEAVSAAMSISGGNDDREIVIMLDGKTIATSTTRYQRQLAKAMG